MVLASLVHVLPIEVGQGTPLQAHSRQESFNKASDMLSASLLILLFFVDTQEYQHSMKIHRQPMGRQRNWKGDCISTFLLLFPKEQ